MLRFGVRPWWLVSAVLVASVLRVAPAVGMPPPSNGGRRIEQRRSTSSGDGARGMSRGRAPDPCGLWALRVYRGRLNGLRQRLPALLRQVSAVAARSSVQGAIEQCGALSTIAQLQQQLRDTRLVVLVPRTASVWDRLRQLPARALARWWRVSLLADIRSVDQVVRLAFATEAGLLENWSLFSREYGDTSGARHRWMTTKFRPTLRTVHKTLGLTPSVVDWIDSLRPHKLRLMHQVRVNVANRVFGRVDSTQQRPGPVALHPPGRFVSSPTPEEPLEATSSMNPQGYFEWLQSLEPDARQTAIELLFIGTPGVRQHVFDPVVDATSLRRLMTLWIESLLKQGYPADAARARVVSATELSRRQNRLEKWLQWLDRSPASQDTRGSTYWR